MSIRPPELALWLLSWAVPPEQFDTISGDLAEVHTEVVATRGRAAGWRWYWSQSITLSWAFVRERSRSPRATPTLASARRSPPMKGLGADISFAWRMMRKNPWMSTAAVVALGCAMAVTIGGFGLLWDIYFAQLPFRHGTRFVAIYDLSKEQRDASPPLSVFREWESRQTSFDLIAASFTRRWEIADGEGGFVRYPVATITAEGLAMPSVPPMLGRLLTDADEQPGAEPVAVISARMWQSLYGGRADVLGRTLTIDRDAYTIVGVMPADFRFPISDDVWLAMSEQPAGGVEPRWLHVFGRLSEGTSVAQAEAELGAIRAGHAADHPERPEWRERRTALLPYTQLSTDPQADLAIQGMFLFVVMVLVVAAASVANLLFSRALARSSELAVRAAMGAGRGQLVRQMFIEAWLLTATGAVVGVVLAHTALTWFKRSIPIENLQFWVDFGINVPAAICAVVAAFVAAAIAGVVPAIRATGVDMHEVLKDGQRGTSGFRFGSVTGAITVVEVTLAIAFLAGAGLAARSLLDAARSREQLPSRQMLVADVALVREFSADADHQPVVPDGSIPPAMWSAVAEQVRAAVATMPGVRAATIADSLPLAQHSGTRIEIEGETAGEPTAGVRVLMATIAPNLFATFDRPVVAGRAFSAADSAESEPVAIVNAPFARRFFGSEHPVGRRFRPVSDDPRSPWLTIVGIVGNLPMNPSGNDAAGFYRPLAQHRLNHFTLAVRTDGAPLTRSAAVREAVARVDTRIAATQFMTHDDLADRMTVGYQMLSLVFVALGGAALFLAVAGLYAVQSFSVTQRTREIGIRMALGSSESGVIGVVMGRGFRHIGIGIIMGWTSGFALTQAMSYIPIGMSPGGPMLLAASAGAMLLAGLGACVVPITRALRVQPMEALRHD